MKLAVCQLPDDLSPGQPAWLAFVRRVHEAQPDLAVLNEMPFGTWVARQSAFDPALAADCIAAHEAALPALRGLPAAVIASRPVPGRARLANEAFLMAGGVYSPIHHKHYFPQETGFFEETWFAAEKPGFDVIDCGGLRVGVLLCSELMFTEWARHYRRQGAHVIVVPRASSLSMRYWDAAARMAAIVSGCYVASSNRVSKASDPEPRFGGRGFVYSPTGELLCETSVAEPFSSVDIDVELVVETQANYPCYVRELAD